MLAMVVNDNAGHQVTPCRSGDHREHARSYRGYQWLERMAPPSINRFCPVR